MRYVIFDTETGGFDPTTDAVISLGAVVWDSAAGRLPGVDNEFYRVVRDGEGRLDSGALRVNGFTPETIAAQAYDPTKVWAEFKAFCQKGLRDLGPIKLGGHNTGFDVGFLRRLARISGNAARFDAVFSHRTVCTMNTVRFLSLAGVLRPGLGALGQCVGEFAIEKQEEHNALGDAKMAADLLTRLIELVRRPAPDAAEARLAA